MDQNHSLNNILDTVYAHSGHTLCMTFLLFFFHSTDYCLLSTDY